MSQERTVQNFLERVIRCEKPPTRVVLVLVGAKGTQGSDLYTLNITDARRYAEDDEIDAAVGVILKTAQDDANGWGGVNKYVLHALYADGTRARSSVFRVRGLGDEDGADEAGSEPATSQGALAQSMRLTETFARALVTLASSTASHQAETIARISEENSNHRKHAVRQIELTEQLLTNTHQRDLEMKREDRKGELALKALERAMPFVQIAGAKLLTNGKIPAVAGQDVLTSFLRRLRPEQLERMWQILDADQATQLLELSKNLVADATPTPEPAKAPPEPAKGGNGERSQADRPGTGFH